MGKLTAIAVRSMTKPGTYGDGDGLYVQVRGPESRSWLFRYKLDGKPRLMGLGALADVPLAVAREAAGDARKLLRQGVDPLTHRQSTKTEAAARRNMNTFREVAAAYIAAHTASWRSAKHGQQWVNTLATYVYPIMGDLGVATVGMGEVMQVLEPIWQTKPETAARVRGRIEVVLDYARARGWRDGENPARWRGHLDNVLPARAKVRRIKHHAALPWHDMGGFMATLSLQPGMAALALRFAILTAARTGEVIGARWPEIDMAAATWTVPADRMKAGREHRVPLSEPALAILRELRTLADPDGFVFPGGRPKRGLSNMAMLLLLRRMERADITAQGFRSAFRDWCSETTAYPAEVAEAALAHVVGDKVEAAYRRGDLFEKRRRLMADWAAHCLTPVPPDMAEVVPMPKGS